MVIEPLYTGCSENHNAPKAIRYSVTGARGGTRNFPTGGLTLPTRGLKYGFQGTVNAKILRKNRFSPSDGGLAYSDGGL